MSEKNALTLSIGILGAVAVWLTAMVIQVPVWVVFIAWASFFILGGGRRGLLQSFASNLTGIAIASLCLLVAEEADLGVWLTGVVVGIGSALMVAVSRVPLLAAIPAIVWGFASTVGTTAASGRDMFYTNSIGHPVLIVVTAMLLGGLLGLASESLAKVMITYFPRRFARPGHIPRRSARPGHIPRRFARPGHFPRRFARPGHFPRRSARPGTRHESEEATA